MYVSAARGALRCRIIRRCFQETTTIQDDTQTIPPLPTSALEYELPPERIATQAAEPRDSAKLLVCSRSDAARREHRTVRDLPGLLEPGDLLVFNRSSVLPARFEGHRLDTGGKVEGLYLRPGPAPEPAVDTDTPSWVAMIKARRFKEGAPIRLRAADGSDGPTLTLVRRVEEGDEKGAWIVSCDDPRPAPEVLERFGRTPLPPYIVSARKQRGQEISDEADRQRYQTSYADASQARSVAAPTAGLHFTDALLDAIGARGVQRAAVVLHVGAGTFKPVETETLQEHPMHAEWCELGNAGASVRKAKAEGRRVIAVGTTTARTLETYGGLPETEWAEPMATRLLISPGYRWRVVDGMLTNFHLPSSTLLAMVGALLGDDVGGVERLKSIYAEAIAAEYRFFSYGDAMLVLP